MKSFIELYKHDFGTEIRLKPTFLKGSDGKPYKNPDQSKWLDYIEWATVLVALYHIGEAKTVSYGSEMHPTKKNTLKINLIIDEVVYSSDYPIIDGNAVITDPNQMQIHKAELRGFVKCVAIHTGLGLSLWQKEESHMAEFISTEPKKERHEHEDNTIEFLEWVSELDKCKTVADLGALYNSNKDIVEKDNKIKSLFLKKKAEFELKVKK